MKIRDTYGREWPLHRVLLSVRPGWGKIVEKLISDLFRLGWDGQLDQIKEKYGGLRFYTGSETPAMWERIREAEDESLTVCEECGKPGKLLTVNSWFMTRCNRCLEERV